MQALNYPKSLRSHLSLLGATLLFSINYWVAKGLMPDIFLPMQIIFFRVAGSMFLYFIFDKVLLQKTHIPIAKSDIPRLVIAGILGVTLNQILFFSGLNLTTPVDTAIINSTNPLIVLLFSSLLTSEKLGVRKIMGILTGAFGALSLVVYGKTEGIISGGIQGNSLIVANTISWSLYLVIAKPLFEKYHPVQVMKWVFLFGFLFSFPFIIKDMLQFTPDLIPVTAYWSLSYIIIGTTFLAYLFITFGLRNLSPSIVSVYTYAQPVLVAVIGLMLFNDELSLHKVVSFILVITGIVLTSRK